MAAVTGAYLKVLRPHLEPGTPNDKGEVGLFCPLHDDKRRSASLNLETGDWYCHACDFGSNVEHLITLFAKGRGSTRNAAGEIQREEDRGSSPPKISEGTVGGWHNALLSNRAKLDVFVERRGLSIETIDRFQIGWDSGSKSYTIPIRDKKGAICNVRHYEIDPPEDRRKIWSVMGMGTPVLYPIDQLEGSSEILICEGELDALISIQNGIPAVTRTGAAKVWKAVWNHHFDNKLVYICHDMDEAGQAGNAKVALALKGHARELKIILLPYEVTADHGSDITDFYLDGRNAEEFRELLTGAVGHRREKAEDQVDLTVLDSFDANLTRKRLSMRVTITGRRSQTFLVPKDVDYACNQAAGAKCQICPMNEMDGKAKRHVESSDPFVLEMMNSNNKQMEDILRRVVGAQKCPMLQISVESHRSVEELYVRPSVDIYTIGQQGDQVNRRITSVGRHDSLANNTVEVIGAIHPNPRTQHNEFQAWEVIKTETSIDRFEITPVSIKLMNIFKVAGGQRPMKKLGEISRDHAKHVTHIYGREMMHAMFDLVFHSALQFEFGGKMLQRGWLEGLVIGDTRTGKSDVAQCLIRHYGAGEMVSCESATFAGIVGGLQQYGGDKNWEISWGAVPINDRRLVVLDEISGLSHEQIAQMSSIRSSGQAQLTKILSQTTWARTRLLWMGNPRQGRMSDYTYGVQAILPLIGNNEDIARFDMAMSVAANEVDPAVINQQHSEDFKQTYTSQACRELLLWVWSRKPDQVVWDSQEVQQAVYDAALDLSSRYVEFPPLIQTGDVRIKVARIAVALAARTFSTDASHECIVVKKVHVADAVRFLDMLYSMPGFGYNEISAERIRDTKEAEKFYDDAKQYLAGNKGLAKFLRGMGGRFRSNDLQDMMNMEKEMANATINTLWKFRMISRMGPEIKINPLLHELLRELKD